MNWMSCTAPYAPTMTTNSWANRKHPSSLRSTVDQRANANSTPITRSRQSPNGLWVPWRMPTTVPSATAEAASAVALTARLDTVNHPFAKRLISAR